MEKPSPVSPKVQEAIQISQTGNPSSATTPEGTVTITITDGSCPEYYVDGTMTDQQSISNKLKELLNRVERQSKGGDGVGHTVVCQAMDDGVDYSVKVSPQGCATYSTVDTSNSTSVQVMEEQVTPGVGDKLSLQDDLLSTTKLGLDDMEYRNRSSSVGSVMSVLSPPNTLQDIQEVSVDGSVAQKVPHYRPTSGGKDRKGLKSSVGKPYPTATASNGRISRLHREHHECALYDDWYDRFRKVEEMYQHKTDCKSLKVERLRKDCQKLFDVVLCSPLKLGNEITGKGKYRLCWREQYGWDDSVPFCSLNNGPKKAGTDGNAPRAKRDDLVQIYRYLLGRYESEIRPKMIRTEANQLIRLAGIQEFDVPTTVPAVAPPPPQPQLANTVHNYIAATADTVKAEPVIAKESSAWNSPVPVSSLPPTTETNSFVSMETETNNTTLDLNTMLKIMGENILMTTDGEQDFSGWNIEPREQESQMDTDSEMAYRNPEMKGDVKAGEPMTPFTKVKQSYRMTKGEKEAVNQELPGMTVTHDSTIPGAVLQLAETKANTSIPGSSVIQTVNGGQYMVAKMAEKHPYDEQLMDDVMEVIDKLDPGGRWNVNLTTE